MSAMGISQPESGGAAGGPQYCQLRRDLEDDPSAIRSAVRGCAIQITHRIQCQTARRKCPIAAGPAAGAETVQRGIRPGAPGGGQLKNRAETKAAALVCRAVKITGCIHNQAAVRSVPGEAGEHRKRPALGARQLEDRATSAWAIAACGAVKVTCRVQDHAAVRQPSVAWPLEAVKDPLAEAGPRWRQLINRAPAVCTAGTGGAIQATGLVEDYARPRFLSVPTLTEAVNNAFRPAAT